MKVKCIDNWDHFLTFGKFYEVCLEDESLCEKFYDVVNDLGEKKAFL